MTTPTLSFGTALTSQADALEVRTLAEVAALITTDAALQQMTGRLRSLRALDAEAYRTAKTRLPYLIGSVFAPDSAGRILRRTEQFVAAHFLVLDFDNCSELNGKVPDAVREDEYVALAFVSPSGTGLKVIFRLLEPCTDSRQYSVAYRAFAGEWASRHRWASGLDLRTSDVTRACFLSYDPMAYHNADAMPVDWQRFLAETDELPVGTPTPGAVRQPASERPINEAAYQQVLRQVNPNRAPARHRTRPGEKQVFVPERLNELEPEVRGLCHRLGWTLAQVQPLNYGLKFIIRQGLRSAEVNVHWGKRGFSVVRSPKTGTDPLLSERLYEQLYALLFPASVVEKVPTIGALSPN